MTFARADHLVTKTDLLRQALCEGRDIDALRIANGFRMLPDQDKVVIRRGWDAHQTPSFARAIKRDPDELVRAAIAAVRAIYAA